MGFVIINAAHAHIYAYHPHSHSSFDPRAERCRTMSHVCRPLPSPAAHRAPCHVPTVASPLPPSGDSINTSTTTCIMNYFSSITANPPRTPTARHPPAFYHIHNLCFHNALLFKPPPVNTLQKYPNELNPSPRSRCQSARRIDHSYPHPSLLAASPVTLGGRTPRGWLPIYHPCGRRTPPGSTA